MAKIKTKILYKLLKFCPRSYFSKQASHPKGLFGKYVMTHLFNEGNANLIQFMLEQYQPDITHTVMDIGFGPGQFFEQICDCVKKMVGIDYSEDMVAAAQKNFSKLVAEKKLELQHASIEKIPYLDNSFNAIFTANTIYFWPEPEKNAAEVLRTLKKGGQFYIGLGTRDQMKSLNLDSSVFTLYAPKDVKDILLDAGFKKVFINIKETKSFTSHCVVGVK